MKILSVLYNVLCLVSCILLVFFNSQIEKNRLLVFVVLFCFLFFLMLLLRNNAKSVNWQKAFIFCSEDKLLLQAIFEIICPLFVHKQ